MALSSAALMLAANGRRVLAIDWDLAKPSLAMYLTPFLPVDALENDEGVIDVVWGYASAVRKAPPTDVPELQLRFADVSPSECAIPDELRVRSDGALHLLSAGREPRRSLRVRYFSWVEFFDRLDGEGLLTTLLKGLKRRYDHILIDCPQFSHASKFPILNADLFIPCFTLDRESAGAAAALTHWMTERLTSKRLIVCPLALRVEHAEYQLLDQARRFIEDKFRKLEAVASIQTRMEVPETPFYAYQRLLPPLVSIGAAERAYQQLACVLAGQPDIEWTAPDNQQLTKYRSAYEAATDRFIPQAQPLSSPYSGHEPYAFVSYARDDRDEVLPILQELTELGFRMWWDEEIPGGSEWQSYLHSRIENARHMLVFLSMRSVRSTWVAEEILSAHKFGKPFLSIKLDWSEVAGEVQHILSGYQMLDKAASDFREQLARGMHRLHASSGAT